MPRLPSSVSSLSSEVAEWQPGGAANSIASLLAHTIVGEDVVINQMLKGGQQLFESGDWAVKTGIPAEDNEIWQPGWSLNIEAFDAYRREVQQSTDAFVAGLDPATLDDDIEAFGSPRRRGWMLRVAVSMAVAAVVGVASGGIQKGGRASAEQGGGDLGRTVSVSFLGGGGGQAGLAVQGRLSVFGVWRSP